MFTKMRCLELCCGTQSFSKVAREYGHECDTVDTDPAFSPTILGDVRDMTGLFAEGQYDFVWASPPCTGYSIANRKPIEERDMDKWDGIARACLQIIRQINPRYWIIENPMGLLRHRDFMQEYAPCRTTVSYCLYGLPYRKNTDLWNNFGFIGKRCQKNILTCNLVDGRHTQTAEGGGVDKTKPYRTATTHSKRDRYRVPDLLIRDILKCTSPTVYSCASVFGP